MSRVIVRRRLLIAYLLLVQVVGNISLPDVYRDEDELYGNIRRTRSLYSLKRSSPVGKGERPESGETLSGAVAFPIGDNPTHTPVCGRRDSHCAPEQCAVD